MASEQISNSPLILLTGGRGRLASAICDFQTNRDKIQAFSRTEGEGCRINDELLQTGLWDCASTLIHAAWSTVPVVSERAPAIEWEIDLPWLARIIRHFGEIRASEPIHFIFFSSGGTVYGDAKSGSPSRESDLLSPKGWHGLAKVQAESLVQQACHYYKMPCTILRISNPYGMGSAISQPQGIIPILIRSAFDGSSFRLWGDGTAVKDFIHISDFNDALNRVISRRITGIYNLCSGSSVSVESIIGRIQNITGRTIDVVNELGYDWDVLESRLDNSAFCNVSGWNPFITLDEGLCRCIESMRSNYLNK